MLKLLLLVIYLFAGCKQVATTKHALVGRQTLFDKIIAEAPDGKVPYPFAELISYLSRYGKPLAVLVPLGRSLQNKGGYPHPFRDPRRIVTFIADINSQLTEFDLQSRLFLAYVEEAKQIEVISLLPGATEFDFQLVENYGKETITITPEQSLCHTCHQHAGPIFTPFPWAESNFNPFNNKLIADYYPNGKIDDLDIVGDRAPFFQFDQIIRDADQLMMDNRIWRSCATTSDPISCRRNLLQNTLSSVSGLANKSEVNVTIDILGNSFLKDRSLFEMIGVGDNLQDYQLTSDQHQLIELIANKHSKITANDPRLTNEARQKIIIEYATILLNNSVSNADLTLEQRLIIKTFRDEQRTILNNLDENQRAILIKTMRQVLQHIHSKDLHLLKDSGLDPKKAMPRRQSVKTRFGYKFRRLLLQNSTIINALHQQLAINKAQTTFIGANLLITSKGIERIININSLQVGFPIDLTNISRSDCQNENYCQLEGVPFFDDEPPVTIVWQRSPSSTTSKLTIDGPHRLEFKCWNPSAHHYSCSIFDRDKLVQALNKIDTNLLGSPIFDEVAIIKQLLANLGFQLETTAWKIALTDDFIDHHHSHLDDQDGLQLSPAGQVMLKHCASCHSNEATPAPFLRASNLEDFCGDFDYYRQLIHTRVTDDSMPPINSPQRQTFTDDDKKNLLEATSKGLAICR